MEDKEALEILKQAINYKEDGSTQAGNWILSTKGIEAVKIAIKTLEDKIKMDNSNEDWMKSLNELRHEKK